MDINQLLNDFKDKEVFYKANPGNGGDALIAHGAYTLFRKNGIIFRIIKPDMDLNEKVVFYAGGGNLNNLYSDCAEFIAENHHKANKLVLLPHTVVGNEELLQSLDKNVYIICRERKSFEHVSKFKNLNVLLIEDLAFNIDPKNNFELSKTNSRLLYLMNLKSIITYLIKDFEKFKKLLKSYKRQKVLYAFREDSERSFEPPQGNIDVSAMVNLDGTMENPQLVAKTASIIFSFLDQFEEIYTNRLHICIASALLDKTVYFYGNSYWKNESVFEHSIKDRFKKVKWMGYER
tara:strand:+ start:90 stop:962 length:873 start_codon:yes stop_codon:yes gene_type:complete